MKQETIEQLRSYLSDNRWCQSDFEQYDVPALQETSEPFFWMVRDGGTSLCFVGYASANDWYATEGKRFQIFRELNAPISGLLYWNDSTARYFYWDGYELKEVTKDDVEEIYDNLHRDLFVQMVEKYRKEFEVCKKELKVCLTDGVSDKMQEALNFAKSIGDNSLQKCLDSLKCHGRYAVNHEIWVFNDFCKHSFTFSEMMNDNCIMNGGIIYHEDAAEKHWNIHT